MRKAAVIPLVIFAAGLFYTFGSLESPRSNPPSPPFLKGEKGGLFSSAGAEVSAQKGGEVMVFTINSTAFKEGGAIPKPYTCDGADTNPPLAFSDIPDGAKSLVLIMDDPDVPKNIRPDGQWDHWIVFNMPPDTREIGEDTLARGVYGKNTFEKAAYGGPCPPDREHRYFFKLYALDALLDFSEGAVKKDIEQAMEGHVLAKAELMGTYDRQKE